MGAVEKAAGEQAWTRDSFAAAAKLLRVHPPRVSDLMRGRIDLFSIETLIDMLGHLGVQVRLVAKPIRRRHVA
jgi:predicted XRE-type DNA-binding protein